MATSAISSPAIRTRRISRLQFPTSAGILLGFALCGNLAAIVSGIFGEGLVAGVCFIGGQFALSLALLRLYDGAWVFQDIRFPFVVFMFLYGFTLPAISVVRSMNSDGLAEAAILFGTALLGFNIVQWWYKQPWRDVPLEALDAVRPTFANAAVVVLSFMAVLAYAVARGTREFLTLDRSQMAWLYTQTWVVSMMLMNGFVMYMFAGWTRLSRSAKRLVAFTIFAFVIFHIGLGNRRDFLAMFIFLIGLIASRRRSRIGLRTILIALSAFMFFLMLGVLRQVRAAPWLLTTQDPLVLVAEQNEFVMPIQTVTYYVSEKRPLKYGQTYLEAPSAFIPRVIWPEKPVGLSAQFNKDRFGDAIVPGYAYTPVTEAFINFSVVGPFIIMSLVSLATVLLVRHARDKPMLYFLAFALVLDFNRGDSAGVFYSMVVIGVSFAVMKFLSRIEWAPARLREMWPVEGS